MKRISMAVIVLAALALVPVARAEQEQEQVPLPATLIPQFVDPLPIPVIIPGNTGPLTLTMCEFKSSVLPTGTFAPGVAPETWTWGYIVGTTCPTTTQSTYLGPIIVAQRGVPTPITFINNLGYASTTNVLAYKNSVDQTLHWADPEGKEANACSEEAMMNMGQPPEGECAENYKGPIPAVVHLHGGDVPPQLDGGPDAWYTSDGLYRGHGYYSFPGTGGDNTAVYRYPNEQEPALIWFHDHTLGATRLNVYAGLAGGYLLTDPTDTSIPSNLPPPVPIIVQDRQFDKDGQLYFPAGLPEIPNPDHPYWIPEFTGNVVAVNGKVWPYLEVEPKRYRLLFVNGSNARAYEMFLTNAASKVKGPAMWQIGTDGGFLDHPVLIDPNSPTLNKLTMMPGERADVIVDFAGLTPGTNLVLRNVAKTPFPNGDVPSGNTLGRVMQFRVVAGAGGPDTSYNPAGGGALRTPMVRLADPVAGTLAPGVTAQVTRQLTLNEVMGMPTTVDGIDYEGGPLEILVNNTLWSGKHHGMVRDDFTPITINGNTTYYSELPQEGETEIWEIINITADAHPIHLHLVQFQLMNRQNFDTRKWMNDYAAAFPGGEIIDAYGPPLDYNVANSDGAVGGNPPVGPRLKGAPKPPNANEAGWKDTVIMYPGQVTRIAVRWAPMSLPASTAPADAYYKFDPNGGHGYVWHCHIVDHEDNEMMRPNAVEPNPNAVRTFIKGIDY